MITVSGSAESVSLAGEISGNSNTSSDLDGVAFNSGSKTISAAGSTWETVTDEIGSEEREYQDTGLDSNTTYEYRLRALNEDGHSDWSNEDSATTDSIIHQYEGSGSLSLHSSPFNPTEVTTNLIFKQVIEWDIEKTVFRDLDLIWNTGPSDLFFFRVECECLDSTSDPCESTNFDSNDPNCGNNPPAGSTTIKLIAATDVTDLCEKLKRGFITQPFQCKVKRVQRFTRPVNKDRIEELGLTNECNRLIDVPIDNTRECLDFQVDLDQTQIIDFSMRVVDSITTVEGGGGFTIGGSADASVVQPSAEGDGGFTIGGSADVTSTQWTYEPEAETASLIISGEAALTFFDWHYNSSGGVDIGGSAVVVAPSQFYEGEGGLLISGNAGLSIRYLFEPQNPQITIGGSANAYQVTHEGSGSVILGGSSDAISSAYSYETSGGLSLSGEANIVSSAFSWKGSGGLLLGHFATISWDYKGSGGFFLSSEAGIVWNNTYESEGGVSISGSADVVSPAYSWEGSGGITVDGDVDTNLVESDEVEMGIEMRVSDLEVGFEVTAGEPISLGTSEVTSPCGCGEISQVLQLRTNFIRSGELLSFITSNGLSWPNLTTLTYNKRHSGWTRNFHFKGNSPLGEGVETWDVYFDFVCTDNIGGETLQVTVWKFCAFFRRKNLITGADDDSRMVFTFPSTDVCPTGRFQRLDYSFSYDTQEGTLLTSTGASGTNIVVNDGIKLFSSRSWQLNPILDIEISAVELAELADRVDITPLFPFDPTAPLLTTTSIT